MSTPSLLVLGAIAGLTIFLGLPMGRMRNPRPGLRAFLNALAIGILVFLLVDVFEHGLSGLEGPAEAKAWGTLAGRGAVFALCFGVGLVGLVYYDRWIARRRLRSSFGPGAAAVSELARPTAPAIVMSPAKNLAVLIAIGIGLHNFAEGLAIGQSAAKGEVSLALMLIIGFGLHNATEGFGIVAPLAADAVLPSWRFLLAMGLIGGGPTFFGTLVGHSFVNETVSVGFLALAGGSIFYVISELLNVARRMEAKELLMWGVCAGFLIGVATDLVVTAAGV
jgi:ZIP family zinc transporter